MLAILPALALLTPLQGATSAPGQASFGARRRPPNIVLVFADDFGVDLVGAYGEGVAPPCTPNIDELAAEGMLFRNAWANPVCSPTRAALLTGRYGFRTGIGAVVTPGQPGLLLAEVTIPEVLTGYTSTLTGKWHLAGNLGNLHPNESGFAHFAGTIRGAVQDYFQWTKVTDGQTSTSTTYATTDTTDEAIAAIQMMPEPWFAFVSYNAPHAPFHAPPATLCPGLACAGSWCGNLPANPSTAEYVKAMTEAMDSELGRLLAALDAVDPDAWVFFMGDNGTARMASEPPFIPSHAKGSMFEGGINVPLIVRGPGVVNAECGALVACVDFLATFAELAGVPAPATDSVSMVRCFSDPSAAPRDTVYAERFSPNFATLPFPEHDRAIRDGRYKLIRSTSAADRFYDLLFDPFETANLLPSLTTQEQQAHDALVAELIALGVD